MKHFQQGHRQQISKQSVTQAALQRFQKKDFHSRLAEQEA